MKIEAYAQIFCIMNPASYLCATKITPNLGSHPGTSQRKHTSAPHEDDSTTKTRKGQMIRPTNLICASQRTSIQ